MNLSEDEIDALYRMVGKHGFAPVLERLSFLSTTMIDNDDDPDEAADASEYNPETLTQKQLGEIDRVLSILIHDIGAQQ